VAYSRPPRARDYQFAPDRFNNKIRVIQRRAYGLHDEEYLRLKILTCMLPGIQNHAKTTHSLGRRAFKKFLQQNIDTGNYEPLRLTG